MTLTGHVDSHAEKWDAERASHRVASVRALAIEIDVALPGSSRRNDVDIARAAESALQWTTLLPKDAVKIMAEGGWVTLTGEMKSEYQQQSASAAVRYLMGVTGVSDQIAIKPKVTAGPPICSKNSHWGKVSPYAWQRSSLALKNASDWRRNSANSASVSSSSISFDPFSVIHSAHLGRVGRLSLTVGYEGANGSCLGR